MEAKDSISCVIEMDGRLVGVLGDGLGVGSNPVTWLRSILVVVERFKISCMGLQDKNFVVLFDSNIL